MPLWRRVRGWSALLIWSGPGRPSIPKPSLCFVRPSMRLLRLGRWPLLLLVVIFGLAVLCRYGPSRREPRWQWIRVGSAFAAIAWLISSALLSWYLFSFADYNATYGSLGVDFRDSDHVRGAAEFRD